MTRSEFDSKKFVGRNQWLERIITWAQDPIPPEHRVWSLIGAPGQGKSWLLEACRQRLLLEDGNQCVFWLNLSHDLTDNGERRYHRLLPERDERMEDAAPRRRQWLVGVIEEARAQELCGDQVRRLLDGNSFEAALDRFVDDLCQRCQPPRAPILIIDGFDEVTGGNQRQWLETRLMARFLGRDCTRLLVARRDGEKMRAPALRWSEKVHYLDVLTEKQGAKQCEQEAPGSAAALRKKFAPYSLTHAGINNELLQKELFETDEALPLTIFREVLDEVVKPNELTDDVFNLLARLAQWENVEEEAQSDARWWWQPRKLSVDSSSMSFERLADYGLVHEVQADAISGAAFYQVADGVREFLRAYHHRQRPSPEERSP